MIYKATIFKENDKITKDFSSILEAAKWLDSENNSESTITIEALNDNRNEIESFVFYTEKEK